MAKVYVLSCGDLGVDCDFETHGASVEEVIEQCAQHAGHQHGMKSFSPELFTKMRGSVRVVEESPADPANPNAG